ncbi:MAG TPA: histidine kinase, partial [Chloroflexota bacterium]
MREGILGLRTSLGPGRSLLDALREYLEQWQEQSPVRARLVVEPSGASLACLSPAAELQLLRI